MKLSELSTDRAADVLCEISVFLLNITSDEDVITSLKLNTKEAKTVAEKYAMAANRVSQWVPMLLKTHREDVFGILAVLNEKNVDDIREQKIVETLRQIREIAQDKELIDFFSSCVSEGKE
jgi:hypothetical protein|nr:MAG TPA: hypothetical protein [Caudoviricetes sp.]